MAITDELYKDFRDAAKLWSTIDIQVKQLASDYQRMDREFSDLRMAHIKLEGRMASLEGLRDSMSKDAKMEIKDALHEVEREWWRIKYELRKSPIEGAEEPPLLPEPRDS
jgi:hypothetical protein